MALLPHLVRETGPDPQAAVIWLHGLGASGHDFEPVVPHLGLNGSPAVRFIFPHAPNLPVTINNGYVMPAWYDILEMSIERKVDVAQLTLSARSIQAFIEAQIEQGIPAERIVLIGFSQGGAVALETALTYPHKLAGLLLLSTYFATAETIKPHSANQNIPIEIHHGTQDPVVPVHLSSVCLNELQNKGYQADLKTYAMPHSVCPEQILDIGKWLNRVLG